MFLMTCIDNNLNDSHTSAVVVPELNYQQFKGNNWNWLRIKLHIALCIAYLNRNLEKSLNTSLYCIINYEYFAIIKMISGRSHHLFELEIFCI